VLPEGDYAKDHNLEIQVKILNELGSYTEDKIVIKIFAPKSGYKLKEAIEYL